MGERFLSRSAGLAIALVAIGLALAALGGSPAVASSGSETFVTLASQPGDRLGMGENLFFDSADATISASSSRDGSTAEVTVSVGPNTHWFHLTFGAPQGQQLETGDYPNARSWAASSEWPFMHIYGDGRDCGELGHFRVRQITTNSAGSLTSLWVDFAGRCGAINGPAFLGEVRYGVRGDGGAAVVGPRDVLWPDGETDYAPVTAPVVVWNPGPEQVQMDASSLSGSDAADDTILSDGCAGVVLAARHHCQVMLRYKPAAAGVSKATLNVPEAGGTIHSVSLEGSASDAETLVTLASEPTDPIGSGQNLFFDPVDASISASLSSDGSTLQVTATSDSHWFYLTFGAPEGQRLETTNYRHARSRPRSAEWPLINVYGDGYRGCVVEGRFRLHRITADSDGTVTSLWVSFAARCGNVGPGLVGEARYRNSSERGAAVVAPRNVVWPDTETDYPATTTPVWIWNPGPGQVQMEASSVSGPDAANTTIVSDGCAGLTVSEGDRCQVVLSHRPLTAGDSKATLTVPESDGTTHSVALEGFAVNTQTFVTLTSQPGELVGRGQDLFFDPHNAYITASLLRDGSAVTVWVGGAHPFDLTFGAPEGEKLRSGDYLHARRQSYQTPELPHIDISGDGRGCNEARGRFRVDKITTDSQGDLTSLWINFEQRCEGEPPALLGEVRYGAPREGAAVVVGPKYVSWPDAQTDSAPVSAPVVAWNPGANPVQMGASSITGPSAADDTIASDGCAGVTLAGGDHCRVVVSYKPTAAGKSLATLNLPEGDGTTHSVSLEGFVSSGRTEFSLQSDPDDLMGQGLSYDYVPTNATFVASGDYSAVHLAWLGTDGNSWQAKFEAPQGDVLTPGRTYVGVGPYGNGTNPVLYVSVNGRDCNHQVVAGSFTITDIYVDKWGDVGRFGVKFEQRCFKAEAALRGTLQFQVNGITAFTNGGRIRVSGEISPNRPGKKVVVKLQKKHAHRFVLARRKTVTLDKSSGYHTRFARPKARRCRAIAVFLARDKHVASRTVKTFHC